MIGQQEDSYFNRNSRWLMPLVAAFILLVSPVIPEILDAQPPIPAWLTSILAVLAFVASGFYAAQTDTFSARIIRFLAHVIAIAVMVTLVMNLIA